MRELVVSSVHGHKTLKQTRTKRHRQIMDVRTCTKKIQKILRVTRETSNEVTP